MEIINCLNNNQFKVVKQLYSDFFRSINFDECYNDKMLDYFDIQDNEIIEFLCRVFVKEKYKKRNILIFLHKPLLLWFKENNVLTMGIKVFKDNNIVKNLERNNWHLERDFADASVFQKKYEWFNSC